MRGSFALVKESFAARFEEVGDGYLFRADHGAVGYRLSAAERDAMVERFARRYARATWAFGVVLAGVLGLLIFLLFDASNDVIDVAIYAAIGGLMCIYVPGVMWLWYDPVRQVRGRTPEAPALDKIEARRMGLERVTWPHLGLVAGGAAFLVWRSAQEGWNRLPLVAAGALTAAVVVQAFRKWRISRR